MRKIIGICLIIFVLLFLMSSFSLAKDEIEGYKGVGWGTSFDEFKTIKNFNDEIKFTDYQFGSMFMHNDDIEIIIGQQIKNFDIVTQRYLFPKFLSVYIEDEDVYYLFYNNKLVMVHFEFQPKNYQNYYIEYQKKYSRIDNFRKKIKDWCLLKDFNIVIFQKNNTIISLIKCKVTAIESMQVLSIEEGHTEIRTSILYASKIFINNIRKEIKKSVDSEKSEEFEETKKTNKKDMGKIE